MPKLYENSRGGYYTKTKDVSGHIVTLQIEDDGVDWLLESGYEVGEELGTAFWELKQNGMLYTHGEISGGGDADLLTTWIPNETLSTTGFEHPAALDEPITVPCDDEFAYVPRFLYAPHKSIYYTTLHVENSSDSWLEVPLLIKHRGAMALLELGAEVGDEFTETGLRVLFRRRWVYLEDERLP